MTSVSEISVVRIPSSGDDPAIDTPDGLTAPNWGPVELPPTSRPSPVSLAVLALVAGIGAMALGTLAVVAATLSGDDPSPTSTLVVPAPTSSEESIAERRVLALLAKPSTERIMFRRSRGRLVLAVGSGGKAAMLIRGFERAPAGRPYKAWVLVQGRAARAATFTGGERAVLLSVGVVPGSSVVVGRDRAEALRPSGRQIVAVRG